MNKAVNRLTVSTLGRIIIGVTLTGTGGLYAMRWAMQSKIRESPTYVEALQCLKENENAVDILGEPIKDKRVDIGDDDCYGRKDNVAWVTVPLQGRRRKGTLHYWVDVSDSESKKFRLSRVELSIEGASVGRILLRDDSADSKTEVPATK